MVKIFFIDDNVNLLNGLKRSLRVNKDKWDMHFFSSPGEALEMVKKGSPHIIVTDYKMPQMSGLELMVIIKRDYPEIKRVILSGQYKEEDNMEKIQEAADIFLLKPCDTELLIKSINELMC